MITHPFIDNESLRSKTIDQLLTTINDLSKKMQWAYTSGNEHFAMQIRMAIESHKQVYKEKMDELMKKQNIKNVINVDRN